MLSGSHVTYSAGLQNVLPDMVLKILVYRFYPLINFHNSVRTAAKELITKRVYSSNYVLNFKCSFYVLLELASYELLWESVSMSNGLFEENHAKKVT